MKTPLSVHVLFHSENQEGMKIYSELYKLLCRDVENPFSDGLDIPVYYSTDFNSEIKLVKSSTDKSVILLFIDVHMFNSKIWRDKIEELMKNQNENILIVGVKLCKYSFSINRQIGEIQSIVFDNGKDDEYSLFTNDYWQIFTTQLFDLLIRYVNGINDKRHINIFISHSKQGNGKIEDKEGENLAIEVRDFIYRDTKLNSFFDVHDILDGYKFAKQIEQNIEKSSVLILFTDSYSSREWCRIELLKAKENKVPMVAVFMMKEKVDRVFPYIGNIPCVVFENDWRKVINILLQTTLNHRIETLLLKQDTNQNTEFFPYPPEAFSLSLLNPNTTKVLYPEPPLGNEELEVLEKISKKMGHDIIFYTPMDYDTEKMNLSERKIGISVSDSPDIKRFGIGNEMFKDLTIELVRYILKANGKIIYGGDLRKDGFTELFGDLARQYGQKEKSDPNSIYIKNYLSWPIYNGVSIEQRAKCLASRIEIVEATCGEEVITEEKNIIPTCISNEIMLKWATSLTKMRVESIGDSDARIIVGGIIKGFKGFMPGIAEEFKISYESKKAIYLIGGFGGCGHIIAEILKRNIPYGEFIQMVQENDFYREFYKYSENRGYKIDYDFFANINIEGLNNGLTTDENIRLFDSVDIIEIVSLILKGLNNIFTNTNNNA